ncbi:MAG: hypothetical protein COU25_03395 [Candidatus Levybacteria bacterium CG10_big_fil_rev_8_21_14_0_10_35_13]|nr:MAG: hypothetical protein COU25_03395 [Candidatus Levybacteria bacterium CG10_big_fil_rev_8_21_14_0_10_35_13]
MKKAAYILIVIVLFLAINSLVHSILDLWQKQDLITSAQKELDREIQKNQKLKAQYEYVQTPEFIEKEAHNKLFLVKEGEQEVLISQSLLSKTQARRKMEERSNWEKWLDLFF